MNYEEALEYIHSVSNSFCKPGLTRIRELLAMLKNPEKSLKFIHVGGTNGKGSFCSMLGSVLSCEGYRTGLFTSPHLSKFNERIKICGRDISDGELINIAQRLKPITDSMQDKPTEFELATAMAMLYFKEQACDAVILEVGMGGRLDATNAIDCPLLSVITEISLDHTEYLGHTIPEIAAEKAGIIKKGSPVLYAGGKKETLEVIKKHAELMGSEFYNVNYSLLNVQKADLSGCTFDYKFNTDIHIPLLGLYQPKNAAAVIEAAYILNGAGFKISERSLIGGLKSAVWQARFELLCEEPTVIFDGAHNPDGIERAIESIKYYFKGADVYIVSGVLCDKDYKFIAKKISEVAKKVFTFTVDYPARALSSHAYAKEFLAVGTDAEAFTDAREALFAAFEAAKKEKKAILVLGSLYTYSDIKKAIAKRA